MPYRRRLTSVMFRRALAAALLAGSVSAACTGRRVVVPVSLESASPATTALAHDLGDDREAVRTVAAILRRDLGLPVPDHVTVFVYSSRAGFERGLVDDAHVSPARAAELSDFAAGIGKRRQLLLQQAAGKGGGRERLRLPITTCESA